MSRIVEITEDHINKAQCNFNTYWAKLHRTENVDNEQIYYVISSSVLRAIAEETKKYQNYFVSVHSGQEGNNMRKATIYYLKPPKNSVDNAIEIKFSVQISRGFYPLPFKIYPTVTAQKNTCPCREL